MILVHEIIEFVLQQYDEQAPAFGTHRGPTLSRRLRRRATNVQEHVAAASRHV